MTIPSYTDALGSTIKTALERSDDKLLRVEDIFGADVDELMELVDADKAMRFGFITPYTTQACRRRTSVSRDPRQITKWRNESIRMRRNSPIIIIGAATGREESGLRKVPFIVRPPEVLRVYRSSIFSYLKDNIRSTSPKPLCGALISMVGESLIDIKELDGFFKRVLRDNTAAIDELQKDLWKLRLIPDPRALDDDAPGPRLTRNYQTVELLRNQADTSLEEKQLERLEAAAEEGNATAIFAMKFRSTGKKAELKNIELDALLALMSPRVTTRSDSRRKVADFFGALDSGLLDADKLKAITKQWMPDAEVWTKEMEIDGHSVRVLWRADKNAYNILPEEGQIIATKRKADIDVELAERFFSEDILAAARNADVVKGTDLYESLTQTLVATRAKVAPFLRWHEDLLTLLIANDDYRASAGDYLSAWEKLADTANDETEMAAVSALMRFLSLLDGHWVQPAAGSTGGEYQSVELFCIHPYVLRPLLELATYARTHAGEPKLGARLLWAYDRVLPAYPAIWRDADLFIHSEGAETPTYTQRALRALPSLNTARGISEIIRSFVGLHSYTKRHLSILLIDPPIGGGIGGALNSCIGNGELVERMTVFIAHTDRRDTEFPSVHAKVEYLGNIKSAEAWAQETGVAVHIAVAFRRARDASAGSHTGIAAPSRGLHNSLTASLVPPERADGESGTSWVPKVFLQPRDSNDVVRRVMLLSRQSYSADRLYRISPMLPEQDAVELEKISKICEWFVIASPSPIGLVPPRVFPGNSLTYIGREDCGPYGMFVYARDLFPVRKQFESLLDEAPMAASPEQVEAEVRKLALKVPNGILRLGRAEGQVIAQVGLMASIFFSEEK
jgi:hypothetical protein